jgi:hypothetical protein
MMHIMFSTKSLVPVLTESNLGKLYQYSSLSGIPDVWFGPDSTALPWAMIFCAFGAESQAEMTRIELNRQLSTLNRCRTRYQPHASWQA